MLEKRHGDRCAIASPADPRLRRCATPDRWDRCDRVFPAIRSSSRCIGRPCAQPHVGRAVFGERIAWASSHLTRVLILICPATRPALPAEVFWEFYLSADAPTPPFHQRLLDALGRQKFGDGTSRSGIVRFTTPPLRDGAAEVEAAFDPQVAFLSAPILTCCRRRAGVHHRGSRRIDARSRMVDDDCDRRERVVVVRLPAGARGSRAQPPCARTTLAPSPLIRERRHRVRPLPWFASIRTIDDYRIAPIAPFESQPSIDRVAGACRAHAIGDFEPTSGSSNASKLIPPSRCSRNFSEASAGLRIVSAP